MLCFHRVQHLASQHADDQGAHPHTPSLVDDVHEAFPMVHHHVEAAISLVRVTVSKRRVLHQRVYVIIFALYTIT